LHDLTNCTTQTMLIRLKFHDFDLLQFFLGSLEEADWDQFLAEVYPRMKPFFMMEKGLFQPPSEQVGLSLTIFMKI
jgi:hypothetical protein